MGSTVKVDPDIARRFRGNQIWQWWVDFIPPRNSFLSHNKQAGCALTTDSLGIFID